MHCTGIVKPSGNEPVNCKVREISRKIVEIANKIMLFVVDEIKINPFRPNQIKRGMTKPFVLLKSTANYYLKFMKKRAYLQKH